MNQQRKPLVIVTGLSGSGLSSVLKTLEDLGFEVFDNFPLPLIRALTDEHTGKGIAPPIALGIDTRTRGFSANTVIEAVQTYNAQLLYITCDENILQKRFTETRRRHPLARDKTVTEGIRQEKALLKDVRDCADLRIDTTELSIHDLRHILEGHFQHEIDNTLTVSLMSFGFRRGVPREADI
ncbi:MAG: RNase adapter RapZ, partial [Bdellovibrionales bacterium]